MFKFRWRYFILTLVLLLVEILIAMFVHDAIIRPHIGDLLVVVLIYCFIRSFIQCSVVSTAIAVLLFAYLVEVLQYFHFIDRLNVERSKLAVLILGNAFPGSICLLIHWELLLCYWQKNTSRTTDPSKKIIKLLIPGSSV